MTSAIRIVLLACVSLLLLMALGIGEEHRGAAERPPLHFLFAEDPLSFDSLTLNEQLRQASLSLQQFPLQGAPLPNGMPRSVEALHGTDDARHRRIKIDTVMTTKRERDSIVVDIRRSHHLPE